MTVYLDRLIIANKAITLIDKHYEIVTANQGKLAVRWYCPWNKSYTIKVWTSKGYTYPKFRYQCGGTFIVTIGQFVRWVQGKPCYGSNTMFNFGILSNKVLEVLDKGGFPRETKCVLCGKESNGNDWWNLAKLSGPCCSFGRCIGSLEERWKISGYINE